MLLFLKICLIFLFLGLSFCGRVRRRRGEEGEGSDAYPYFRGHDSPNEPNYGPVMVSNLPVVRKSAADYGYSGNSMDEYIANIDRELSSRRSERGRHHMRSILRPDGWIETKPGEAMNLPLQTASPNIPPDVIAYFEKSRVNDLALAATIEKRENDKIKKDLYFKRNEDNLKNIKWTEQGGHSGRGRSIKDDNDIEGMNEHKNKKKHKPMKRHKKVNPKDKNAMKERKKKTPPKNDQEHEQEKLVDEGNQVGDHEQEDTTEHHDEDTTEHQDEDSTTHKMDGKKPVKARKARGKKKSKGK